MAYTETERVYDQLLLTLMRTGDRRAANRLAARWQPRLMRTARRLLNDPEQARDAVQEAWTGICRGWVRLSDPEKFPAWAYTILHRKCADRIRLAQKTRQREAPLEGAPDPGQPARSELSYEIDQALRALRPEHRSAAILFFSEGLTLAEIAAVMDIPVGTAKSRIFHARKHLKSLLKGEDDD
ncbi:MAG: sigma-70 family RNA polymerase sigma factor [Henriciella sp.]|nr:sigma-70 family RNA polymerase sigma factor [Henriciella sp.]